MMRKNQKYNPSVWMAATVAAGILLFLAGCSDTQEPIEVDGFPVPVEIETASLTGEVETRASDVKNLEQGSIGLYRTADNDYAPIDNTPYSYTEGKWTSAAPTDKAKTIFVDHRNATLYGYYPYAATPDANGTVFNLSLKRFTEADALFYTGDMTNITNRNTALKMQLKPAYSRLTFRLKNYNLPDCVISSMTITPTIGTFITDGTIDIHHTTPTVTKGSTTITEYKFPFKTAGGNAGDATIAADSITVKGIATGQTDETMDMLWIPQNLSGIKITIVLHFNGEDVDTTPSLNNTVSVTISQDKLSQLQQGTQHIIPLLVKGTTISGSITMPSLSVVEAYDPFEEDKITSYTLPPVDVNGVYVATGNVFCYHHDLLNQIWYTFSGKAGGVFGSATGRVNSFTQVEVNSADPCQKVGPNWRTPTRDQLKAIEAVKVGNRSQVSDRGTTSYGWYVGAPNSTDGVFFAEGYKYLSCDGGYLNVTSSSGISYVDAIESPSTKYTVRCVSDTKYGTN